jgi:parallel beta-helix repeat protein
MSGRTIFTDCKINGTISVDQLAFKDYTRTQFINCTIEGDLPTVIQNEVDPDIPENNHQLFIVNCTDVTLSNMVIGSQLGAVYISGCSKVLIENITLINENPTMFPYGNEFERAGLLIENSSGVSIVDSFMSYWYNGIHISDCEDVSIDSINVTTNIGAIWIDGVVDVTITRCTIHNNTDGGIRLYDVLDGNVFFNDFIGNGYSNSAYEGGVRNNSWWNNYWSNHWYTDEDGDGIVDHPYNIVADTFDYSPLARSFTEYDQPPGDHNKAPTIELDERTSGKVTYGNTFVIVFNVTEDRGELSLIEMRVDGGNWTEIDPDVNRESMVRYRFIVRLWADDYSEGKHRFEFRVHDGIHYSDVIEKDVTIESAFAGERSSPFAVDSTFIMQNTFLFLTALIFVFLMKRVGKKRRAAFKAMKDEASSEKAEKRSRPAMKPTTGKPRKPPRKTTSTRK